MILMAITSQLRPGSALGEVWLRHWQSAGLLKPSSVKPIFATFDQRMVVRSLGALTLEDKEALRHAIGQIIG
jgi:mRNA interferase MazF